LKEVEQPLQHCEHARIASGKAKSHQETNMTANAVVDCAKARQADEQALLKN
jgi:hypothetical protein